MGGFLGKGQTGQFKPKDQGFGTPPGGVLSEGHIKHNGAERQG